jgi:hypothetical protein
MPEGELETYDVPLCFCGCTRVERFGAHFRCLACGTEVDGEMVRQLAAPTDGP